MSMNITPRQKRILLLLLQKEIPSKLSDLANSIGVSERTIQRELDAVNFYLKSYHCAIVREKGVGISLKGSIEVKDNLIRDLSGLDEVNAKVPVAFGKVTVTSESVAAATFWGFIITLFGVL